MSSARLFAPVEYWQLPPAAKALICNGCGKKGGLKFPNRIWGLDIRDVCNIHDYMYYAGQTEADREEADRVLRNNLLRIIEADSADIPLLKALRRRRAAKYYYAVRWFGGPAFWDDKNQLGEMQVPGQSLAPAAA